MGTVQNKTLCSSPDNTWDFAVSAHLVSTPYGRRAPPTQAGTSSGPMKPRVAIVTRVPTARKTGGPGALTPMCLLPSSGAQPLVLGSVPADPPGEQSWEQLIERRGLNCYVLKNRT